MIENQHYISDTGIHNVCPECCSSDNEAVMINGRSHFAEIMAYSLDLSKLIPIPYSPSRKLKAVVASRTKAPPTNYVCRLCKVPGHWIDECIHFKPRKQPTPGCLICDENGHRMEQCPKYTPHNNTGTCLNHAAKCFNASSEYFLGNEEFLNF